MKSPRKGRGGNTMEPDAEEYETRKDTRGVEVEHIDTPSEKTRVT